MPFFLGLDVGTQGARAALVSTDGRVAAVADAPVETEFLQPTWAEQEPKAWWRAIVAATREALAEAKLGAADVAALGLDCHACTVVPCAVDGTPLARALLWMDQRAFREAEEISAAGDDT